MQTSVRSPPRTASSTDVFSPISRLRFRADDESFIVSSALKSSTQQSLETQQATLTFHLEKQQLQQQLSTLQTKHQLALEENSALARQLTTVEAECDRLRSEQRQSYMQHQQQLSAVQESQHSLRQELTEKITAALTEKITAQVQSQASLRAQQDLLVAEQRWDQAKQQMLLEIDGLCCLFQKNLR